MTAKRDAYVQKMKAKMDEWNADIDKLEAKAAQAKAESKIEYEKQLEDLRAKRSDMEYKLTELKQAGDSAWEDLKTGIELAWDSFSDSVKSAVSRFKS
ncbi:MAG: hypothetical protein JXA35_06685 [Deltaproteobacteria bacterium]|nr:hypothetical protein [Deltaproteobacteria bacterium]